MTAAEVKVGWLGAGHMGAAMARRLLDAGVDVAIWNRTRSKAEALTAAGASVVEDPSDVADRDVVFTMVSTSRDLEEVVAKLLADPDRTPPTVVDCSTVSTECSAAVRAELEHRGSALLACPVSGNGNVVRAGMLSLMCSGPHDAFERAQPILELLGRHVTYVGEGELSRLVKICHNVFLGVVAQSLAEITVLAEKGGVPRAVLLDAINHSVMGSVFSRYKTPAYVHLDYTPTFTPVLLRKDMDLAARAADELGVPMPVSATAREAVQSALAQGYRTEDFAVLLELQARNSGLTLAPEDTPVDDGLGAGR